MAMVSLTPPAPGAPVEGVPGFAHRYSEGNDARIHYVVGGEGPAVLLLHGFAYTWEDWRRILVPLAAAGFTVIAPDLRGFGYSEKTKDGYSKANVAEDVRAIVRELGFAEVNLVGADIGAMVAYAYASRHPHEVRRFVFGEAPRWMTEALIALVLRIDDRRRTRVYPPLRVLVPSIRFDFDVVRAMQGRTATFATIGMPTLLLSGGRSPRFLRNACEALSRILPDARRVEFARLGHSGAWNADRGGDPAAVTSAMRAFIAAS